MSPAQPATELSLSRLLSVLQQLCAIPAWLSTVQQRAVCAELPHIPLKPLKPASHGTDAACTTPTNTMRGVTSKQHVSPPPHKPRSYTAGVFQPSSIWRRQVGATSEQLQQLPFTAGQVRTFSQPCLASADGAEDLQGRHVASQHEDHTEDHRHSPLFEGLEPHQHQLPVATSVQDSGYVDADGPNLPDKKCQQQGHLFTIVEHLEDLEDIVRNVKQWDGPRLAAAFYALHRLCNTKGQRMHMNEHGSSMRAVITRLGAELDRQLKGLTPTVSRQHPDMDACAPDPLRTRLDACRTASGPGRLDAVEKDAAHSNVGLDLKSGIHGSLPHARLVGSEQVNVNAEDAGPARRMLGENATTIGQRHLDKRMQCSDSNGLHKTVGDASRPMRIADLVVILYCLTDLGRMKAVPQTRHRQLKMPVVAASRQAWDLAFSIVQKLQGCPELVWDADLRDVSQLFWSLVVLGVQDFNILDNLASRTVHLCTQEGPGNVSREARSLATIIWACKKLDYSPANLLDAGMSRIEECLDANPEAVQARDLHVILLSMHERGYGSDMLYTQLADAIASKLPQLHPTRMLPEVIMVYAQRKQYHAALFEGAAKYLCEGMQGNSTSDIANILWSYAVMGCRQEKLFGVAAKNLLLKTSRLDVASAADVTRIIGALSTAQIRSETLLGSCCMALHQKADQWDVQMVADVAIWLARLRYLDQDLMSAICGYIAAESDFVHPRILTKVMLSCAELGYTHRPLMDAVVQRVKDEPSVLGQLGPGSCVSLAWSLESLARDQYQPFIHGLLSAGLYDTSLLTDQQKVMACQVASAGTGVASVQSQHDQPMIPAVAGRQVDTYMSSPVHEAGVQAQGSHAANSEVSLLDAAGASVSGHQSDLVEAVTASSALTSPVSVPADCTAAWHALQDHHKLRGGANASWVRHSVARWLSRLAGVQKVVVTGPVGSLDVEVEPSVSRSHAAMLSSEAACEETTHVGCTGPLSHDSMQRPLNSAVGVDMSEHCHKASQGREAFRIVHSLQAGQSILDDANGKGGESLNSSSPPSGSDTTAGHYKITVADDKQGLTDLIFDMTDGRCYAVMLCTTEDFVICSDSKRKLSGQSEMRVRSVLDGGGLDGVMCVGVRDWKKLASASKQQELAEYQTKLLEDVGLTLSVQ